MWYGTLSILMWIKVNVLSSFKNFQVFTLLDQKICFKNFLKEKITKAPAGFELITYIFVVNALTHSATVLSNYFGKDKNYKTVLDFFLFRSEVHVRHNMELSHTTLIFLVLFIL